MKKILVFSFLFLIYDFAHSQDIRGKRVVADKNLIVRGTRIDSISNDTTNAAYRLKTLLTSDAVYKLIKGNAGVGGSAAGNYGNVQVNINGTIGTPGSDSLSYNSNILSVKGVISTMMYYTQDIVSTSTPGSGTGVFYSKTDKLPYFKNSDGTEMPLYNSGGGGTWGSITGTLSSQSDLQSALNAKENFITAPGTAFKYWNGYKQFVSLNTDSITEGSTNKFYTDTRARAALSFAAGSGGYNSGTGVITIPTNTNQLTNGAGFITSVPAQTWASITGKPTTISGFGITDGVTLTGVQTLTNKNLTSGTNTFPTFNQNTTGQSGSVANALTVGTGLQLNSGTTYNGSAARTISVNIDTNNIANYSTKVRSLITGSGLVNVTNGNVSIQTGNSRRIPYGNYNGGELMASDSLRWTVGSIQLPYGGVFGTSHYSYYIGSMSTPGASTGVYYAKNDGLPYFKNAAGTEMPLYNSGSGVTSATGTGVSLVNGSSAVKRLKATLPITVADNTDSATIAINAATTSLAGSMSGADKAFLDSIRTHNSYLISDSTYTSISQKVNDSTHRDISLRIQLNGSTVTPTTNSTTASWNLSNVTTLTDAQTLTNKRVAPRNNTTTSSATPTINTDNTDLFTITAQTVDITSMTTNLSGTPNEGEVLMIWITGTASRAITWGSAFVASTVALPTTTSGTTTLHTTFVYAAGKWTCAGVF